jgi:predicted SprT family Zn-dependent metalloprotease
MTKAEIEQLARSLMQAHGLQPYWGFRFDNRRRRFGVCSYQEHCISLSWPVCQVNSDADIRDTILHEIAHALTPGAEHGHVWKMQAQMIGARPVRCAGAHVITPSGRWQGQCGCSRICNRYRPPKPGARYQCRLCRQFVVWIDTKAVTKTTETPGMFPAV